MPQLEIDSSLTGLSFAEEVSPKVLSGSPIWYGLEPNTFADYGPTVGNVARKFIVSDRQQRKGSISDFDVALGFNTDLTNSNLSRLMQGFLYAAAREKPSTALLNGTQYAAVSVAPGGIYTFVTGFSGINTGDLVEFNQFSKSANNGYGFVTAVSATQITCNAKVTVAEGSPPSTAYVSRVGIQAQAGDLTLTYAAPTLALNSTAASNPINFTAIGLNVGEWIYVGGDAVATQFANMPGFYGRIASIQTQQIIFDKTTGTASADAGTGKTMQFFFGKFIRQETTPSLIVKRTYQFERTLGVDDFGSQAEYITGALPNTFKFTMPAPGNDAKFNIDMAFMPLGYQFNAGTTGLKAGTRVPGLSESALSVTADLYRARLAPLDPTTLNPTPYNANILSSDFTLNNNAVINKSVGVLGGFSNTVGTLEASGTISAYFSDSRAVAAIRAYSDVTLDYIIAKQNGGLIFDYPLVGMGNGRLTVDIDKAIMMPLDVGAFKSLNGYSKSITIFEYLPNSAMPNN